MRARWTAPVLAILAIGLVGFGWLDSPTERQDAGQQQVAGLQRSESVVQAKIARKQAKLNQSHDRSDRPEHPDRAGEFQRQLRPHPEGKSITELKFEAIKHGESMPVVEATKDAGIWNWDWIGPGNIGGRVRAILTHPAYPDILWIGSASGGIWKTTNGGASWYPLNDFLPSLSVTALVMDPHNSDILYAATGEGFTWMPPGAGIFKSYNGGTTWNQLAATVDPVNLRWINDLIVDPNDYRILFAAAKTETGGGRIIRSYDGGDHWQNVLIQNEPFTDLAIDPDDSNIVLASTTTSVFRSDQNGVAQSWSDLATGATGALPDITGRTSFSFGEGNDMVYASLDVPRSDLGFSRGEVWRSSDNGLTWEHRNSLYHMRTQGGYDNVIWLEPGSTDRVIVGGINLLKSTNGGATFSAISDWRYYHEGGMSAHADQHAIVPASNYGSGSTKIYFGNDGGIQRNDLGFTADVFFGWHNLANNLGITQFYHADASPDGAVILGGTQDNDDLRFTRSAGAQAWYQASTGDGTYAAIDPQTPIFMYAAYVHLEIDISLDGGNTYYHRTDGLWDAGQEDRTLFIAPFALDKVWPTNLVAGGRSIWRTNNRGDYWHEVLTPRSGNPLCSAVEISPSEGSVVTWVGYTDGSIWKTEDIAASWQEVTGTSPGVGGFRHISDIEISPHDRNTVIVVFTGYANDRVWITRNNGATWAPISGVAGAELPFINVNCVTFHPSDPEWIYVGTDVGIYASEDLGGHWSVTPRWAEHEGPVNVPVSDLIWHSNDTLVAVTYGRGLYECRPLDVVHVYASHGGTEDGSYQYPYDTFGEGYGAAGHGSRVRVRDGDYDEPAMVLDKRIILEPDMGETAVIR